MEYISSMTFLTETGEKNIMGINGVKEKLTAEQIKALMDKIIEKNIFVCKTGALVGKSGAQITI
ncbi:DUF2922 domain-containing protein [Clostridium sp. ZS2]|uniref:DUF2922 domain-containing protein n=1 Tax=Clostridium sp. ZS2 TaxID=2949988 RepID=UPI00338D4978